MKRDGSTAIFEQRKITNAILKGLKVVYQDRRKEELEKLAEVISDKVTYHLSQKDFTRLFPSVEEIQDVVEDTLIEMGEKSVAKEYIL